MSVRNKFLIILGVIFAISLSYYLFSTPRSKDMVLIGTVDSNQVVVSPQMQGRIVKLLVDEGTQVKQGDLIALLDPSELQAQERAASAMASSMRSKVAETRATQQSTTGTTSSDVANAQARVNDRTGETRSCFRSGPGSGGKQSQGSPGQRAVARGAGKVGGS